MPHETLKIESLAYTGQGVGQLPNGKVVFVDSALPGDLITFEVYDERARFSRARLTQLHEASPHRVDAACPYAGLCGGCGIQQLEYAQQCFWKRRFVVDCLQRVGGIEDAEQKVLQLLSTPDEWGYRNKIELVPLVQKNRVSLGYHTARSEELLPIDSCLLLPSELRELPAKLSGALSYALKDSLETLKRVSIRYSRRTLDLEIALWTSPSACSRQFLAKVIQSAVPTTSLVRVLVAGDSAKRDLRKVEVLSGKGFWTERLAGFTYQLSAPSFFQVNTRAAELLVNTVIQSVEPPGKTIMDLYSGAGSFTLPLAAMQNQVLAIESAKSSVRDLRRNLASNGLDAQVVGGGVEYQLESLGPCECMVVDPPRSGLSPKALSAIIAAKPTQITYVSCDPATLARDLRGFLRQGYGLLRVTPVDLFPQTYHIESVALLTRI